MMISDSLSNPFDFVKASDFSDQQIERFWVDVAGQGGLEDLFQPRLVTPMLLSGGKGSGKTHLMRYFSSSVRKLQYNGTLLDAVLSDKYLAIYVQADGLNAGRFDGKGVSDDEWAAVFSFYCEVWLATQFLRAAREIATSSSSQLDQKAFISAAQDLFNQRSPNLSTIDDLIAHLTMLRKEIDHVVGYSNGKEKAI